MAQFATQEVLDEIKRQAPTFGIDPKLGQAFFIAENSDDGILQRRVINGATTSPAGARGVMQTMPQTEELLKKAGFLPNEWQYNPSDLRGQVQAGLAAIKEMQLRQKNKNDPFELAAMYNGGTAAWQNYRAGFFDKLPEETRGYFNKIRTALGGGNGRTDMTPQQIEQVVTTPQAVAPAPVAPGGGMFRGSTASTRISSNAYDPAALAAAMSTGYDIIKAGGTVDTALANIERAAAERIAAETAQQQQITATAVAQGQRVTAETAIEASAAARRAKILTDAGINPDQINNIAQQAMTSVIEGSVALETEGAEIDQRMAVGIFDNPLQWLINQTRLPGMVGSYNAKVAEQNRKINAAQQLQELANTQISLSQGIDADLITAKGVARTAEIASVAQEKLNEAKQAVAGNAIRDAQLAATLAGQKFTTAVNIAELTKQIKSENTALSDREAAREAERLQLEGVNKWLKMIGSQNQFDSPTFKSLPAKTREELISAAGTGRISNDLYSGILAIQSYGNSRNMAAQGDAASVAWLTGLTAEAQKRTADELKIAKQISLQTGKPIKEEEFLANTFAKLQTQITAEYADMRTASDFNPAKIDYATAIKDPVLKDSSIAKFLREFGPMSANPVFNKVDEKLILERLSTEVAAGKKTSGQAAAEISQFYKTASELQVRATKYPLFGLDTPGNGYTVVIPGSGLFDRPAAGGAVDLTNPAAVESFIIKDVALKARFSKGAGPYRPFFDPLGLSKPGVAQ